LVIAQQRRIETTGLNDDKVIEKIKAWMNTKTPIDHRNETTETAIPYIEYLLHEYDKLKKENADLEAKASRYDAQERASGRIEHGEDYYLFAKVCLDCLEEMEEVHPGKWQCNNPDCNRTERKKDEG